MSSTALDETAVRSHVADFSLHKCSFILSPTQWKQFKLTTRLKWEQKPLVHASIPLVPETRGVYAHSIGVNVANMPPTNYVTYVGLVGDKKKIGPKGQRRHLRQRFKEYLQEQETPGRPLVWDILSQYDGFITFHYAEIADHAISLHAIETALLDALLPPCNTHSFSINIKQAHQIAYRK